MRTKKGLSKEFSVFEFNEEDELIERTSRKLLRKYNKNLSKFGSDDSPVTKYNFLKCFAHGTKSQRKSPRNEPLDVDAVDGVVEERIFGLDAAVPSTSSNCKPVTRHYPNHHDCGSNSYTARAQNHGNMAIGIDSDDDGSNELCSSTSTSIPVEGPLKGQLQEHGFGACDIQTVVVLSPEYIICGDMFFSKSRLTFSCSCIKLDGSTYGAKAPFSFRWAVTDILKIDSHWSELLKTATLNLCLKSKDKEVAEYAKGSGIMELKFSVFDPRWPKRQEEIKSLDLRYNDIWNVAFDIDAARKKDVFLGQNSIFCSKHYFVNELSLDESFEEIIYPKGDHDAVLISKRDVQLLQPETFLNDTIIDFYILYLKNKVKPEETHRFHFFNSFFFRKLADLDKDRSRACESTEAFQRVRKWTRKVDIFEKDYIFIPVNFSLHWSLIVICHPGEVVNVQDEEMANNSLKVPCILHMDSIKGSHRGLRNLIQSYLLEEWRERHNGPGEDASSKFFNLQFVPLELPQQENSFDCGLFLLHYVELFLEQAPVNFSYSRISKFSKFLSKDWFPPADASSKRAHIKRLIYKIVEDNSQKVSSSTCDKYSSESPKADGKDPGLEFLCEIRNSCQESFSDSDANQEVDVTPTAAVPLRSKQYFKKSEDNEGSLTVWNCSTSRQIVPLNYFKNAISPIEEGEENEEQSAYSRTHKASDKQVTERTEPLAMEISEEHEKGELSSGTTFNNGSPISSDTRTDETSEFLGTKREEHNEVYECSSSSSDELAGCIVDDSEEENGGDDVIECESSPHPSRIMIEDSEEENGGDDVIACESSPRPIRIAASSTPREVNLIEKIDLTQNRVVQVLELEWEGAKRPRVMDSEEKRRVTRRLLKDV